LDHIWFKFNSIDYSPELDWGLYPLLLFANYHLCYNDDIYGWITINSLSWTRSDFDYRQIIVNAKKLYTVLDVESSTVKSSAGTFSEFTNYAPRLKAYVESIPEDTLKEFKKKLETQPG